MVSTYFLNVQCADTSQGPATAISLKGPQHLPKPLSAASARIQCSGLSASDLTKAQNLASPQSPSALIRKAAVPGDTHSKAGVVSSPSGQQSAVCRRRPADAFQHPPKEKNLGPVPFVPTSSTTAILPKILGPTPLTLASDATVVPSIPAPDTMAVAPRNSGVMPAAPTSGIVAVTPVSPIVSIGVCSDAVLDRFNLGDEVIPRLHMLIGSVCNTHWEQRLREAPWNLDYEQASNLVHVLHKDLGLEKGSGKQVHVYLFRN